MRILLLIFLLANYDWALAQGPAVRFVDKLGEGQIKESLTITLTKLSGLSLPSRSIDFELHEDAPEKAVDINLFAGEYSYEISARTKVEDRWFRSKCHAKGVVNIRGGEVFAFFVTSDPREGDYSCELRQIGSMYAEPTPRNFLGGNCNADAAYACIMQCDGEHRRCVSNCDRSSDGGSLYGNILRGQQCVTNCQNRSAYCRRMCKDRYCPTW